MFIQDSFENNFLSINILNWKRLGAPNTCVSAHVSYFCPYLCLIKGSQWDWNFLQWYCWVFKSSGIWRSVTGRVVTDIFRDNAILEGQAVSWYLALTGKRRKRVRAECCGEYVDTRGANSWRTACYSRIILERRLRITTAVFSHQFIFRSHTNLYAFIKLGKV